MAYYAIFRNPRLGLLGLRVNSLTMRAQVSKVPCAFWVPRAQLVSFVSKVRAHGSRKKIFIVVPSSLLGPTRAMLGPTRAGIQSLGLGDKTWPITLFLCVCLTMYKVDQPSLFKRGKWTFSPSSAYLCYWWTVHPSGKKRMCERCVNLHVALGMSMQTLSIASSMATARKKRLLR